MSVQTAMNATPPPNFSVHNYKKSCNHCAKQIPWSGHIYTHTHQFQSDPHRNTSHLIGPKTSTWKQKALSPVRPLHLLVSLSTLDLHHWFQFWNSSVGDVASELGWCTRKAFQHIQLYLSTSWNADYCKSLYFIQCWRYNNMAPCHYI